MHLHARCRSQGQICSLHPQVKSYRGSPREVAPNMVVAPQLVSALTRKATNRYILNNTFKVCWGSVIHKVLCYAPCISCLGPMILGASLAQQLHAVECCRPRQGGWETTPKGASNTHAVDISGGFETRSIMRDALSNVLWHKHQPEQNSAAWLAKGRERF